jgi:hypothetical protein
MLITRIHQPRASCLAAVAPVHDAVLELALSDAWVLHEDGSASLPNAGSPWFTAVTLEEEGGYAVRQRLADGQGYAIQLSRSPRKLVVWAEQAVAGWQAASLGGSVAA